MPRAFQRENGELGNNSYFFWGLIAVELFMSFSYMGYIHIEPISITFVYIPVLIAGSILGVKEASLVGAAFGMASMWKASAFYVEAGDAVFSPVLSGSPVASFLLSVGSRTLFGFITGFLYQLARKGRYPLAGVIVVTTVGRTIHTFLVYLFMETLFPEIGFTVANTMSDIARWDYIPFVLIADVVVAATYIFCRSAYMEWLLHRVRTVDKVSSGETGYKKWVFLMLTIFLACSFSVAVYFTNRISTVMEEYGLDLHEKANYDLMHLQIQFLLGIISLSMIVIIVIVLYHRNSNYLYYEARLDNLTGIFGRQLFFQTGEKILDKMQQDHHGMRGCFIILDIDEFKKINDVYGHPEGDKVLKQVAEEIGKVFYRKGILGRLGGDEFVILVDQEMSREEAEAALDSLKDGISRICMGGKAVTCSVGVIPVEKEYTIDELYKYADRLLYEAKKKGKDQVAFGYRFRDQKVI